MNVETCIIMLYKDLKEYIKVIVKLPGKHSTTYGANTENHENSVT